MAKMHTLRGVIPSGTGPGDSYRLILDNGNINSNFIVHQFVIFGNMDRRFRGVWNEPPNNNDITMVGLGLDEKVVLANPYGFTFGINSLIGWFQAYGQATPSQFNTHLDPNHLVIQDLWLGAYTIDTADGSTGVTTVPLNYYILIEEVSNTDDVAVMALIKARSQGDLD
jgi:hypothetical protein